MSNIISFFQKLIKGGGVRIRAGGLENFSKIKKRGGRLFGTREYACIICHKDYKISTVAKRSTVKIITLQFTRYFDKNKLKTHL